MRRKLDSLLLLRPNLKYTKIHGLPGCESTRLAYRCQHGSTTQSTFKNISTGLTRQTKNEEKDGNNSNASLFTSALGFSSPDHMSNTPKNGCNTRDKIQARFRRYCCGFLSTLYKSFGL